MLLHQHLEGVLSRFCHLEGVFVLEDSHSHEEFNELVAAKLSTLCLLVLLFTLVHICGDKVTVYCVFLDDFVVDHAGHVGELLHAEHGDVWESVL